MTSTLMVVPQIEGYRATVPGRGIASNVPTPAPRYGRTVANNAFIVDVAWVLNPVQFQYFWAFYRNRTKRGALLFNVSLILKDSAPAIYRAHFIPGSLHSACEPPIFSVSAQLEALPNAA